MQYQAPSIRFRHPKTAATYTRRMPTPRDFADFCCELMSGLGPVQAKRMFGGWGLSIEGLTVAIVADPGDGATLWLKADTSSRELFEAEGCRRFTYASSKDGQPVQRSVNYYSAPDCAMDSPHAMLPWGRLALQNALSARSALPTRAKVAPRPAPRKSVPGTAVTSSRSAKRRSQG